MQPSCDELLDIAYQIFLEMAGENLPSQTLALFNAQFAQCGEITLFDTAENWEEDIGVPIDPTQFAEIWIGLTNEQGEMSFVFAKCLINYTNPQNDIHFIWA